MTMFKDNQTVKIYAANIRELPDPKDVPEWMEGFSAYRKEKIKCCKQEEKRKQSLGAGLLLKYVLQQYGKTEATIRIGMHGKPELDGLYFNLSHSKEWVVCGVSHQNVGCDIEKISAEPKGIADRFFCESEKKYLDSLEGEARAKEFFRIWTLKESYMKMTGEGMSLAMNRVEFVFGEQIEVYRDGFAAQCYVKEYEIEGYHIAVCSESSQFAREIETIENLI